MPFKIKDLMVNVLPSDPQDQLACTPTTDVCATASDGPFCGYTAHCGPVSDPPLTFHWCTYVTWYGCGGASDGPRLAIRREYCGQASDPHVGCGLCTYGVSATPDICFTASHDWRPPATSLVALAALKDQLKKQLAEVEKQETAVEDSLRPQTVEDVDMLMKKFDEAILELKARRAELVKKPKPPRKK